MKKADKQKYLKKLVDEDEYAKQHKPYREVIRDAKNKDKKLMAFLAKIERKIEGAPSFNNNPADQDFLKQ